MTKRYLCEQAPLEGITGFIYRNAYAKYYGDADRYFTPFLVGLEFSHREKNEVLPEHNGGRPTVPQILARYPSDFLYVAQKLEKEYGYREVNLNLGCPSGTVVSKKRGSGFLSVPDELEQFFDEVFTKTDLRISVKTRIGVTDTENWERILQIYNRFPLSELIIHPRIQKQMYRGTTDLTAFHIAYESTDLPLVFNGDINTPEEFREITERFPDISGVMCGRGLLKRPWLFSECKGKEADSSRETLLRFTDEICQAYQKEMSGDRPVLYKMKELWAFQAEQFPDHEKLLKRIRKCQTLRDYEAIIRGL